MLVLISGMADRSGSDTSYITSILVPLYKGGKDYWPGYLFATKASGFIILAIAALTMSFIAADGDGKAVYHFAVALTLMYVVLYFLLFC